MISGRVQVRNAYADERVVADYVDRRFREPLGALLHGMQARLVLRSIAAAAPAKVLELAPGPARLSCEVAAAFAGDLVLVDSSVAMLAEAQRRLGAALRARPAFVLGDAFALPVRGQFDFAYAFRLIRHFEEADRLRLYRQIAAVLRPHGLFMFDAVNREEARSIRARNPAAYPVHDALLDPEQLAGELEHAGFEVVSLVGVQKRYPALYRLQVLVAPRSRRLALAAMRALEACPGGQPLEWVVSCRRR